jgi:hypothetical protein
MVYINGFYGSSSPSATGIKSFRVGTTGVILPVKAEVAPLLIGFAKEFHTKVEPLHVGWCWGYAFRDVRGSSSPSFHSAGLAIDLNAPNHPLGRVGTFNARQRATINALCAKYGLRWGGNYTYRKDEMHFEVILNRTDALALVRRLQAPPKPSGLPYFKTGSRLPIHYGNRGTDVRDIQHAMNILGNHLVEDGYFGAVLEYTIKKFQANRYMKITGYVDAITLQRIREAIH